MSSHPDTFTFEQAYERLEEILEKMNSQSVSLEESLHLYEEADGLIQHCNRKLKQAEQKIEMLTKNREGQLCLSEEGQPQTEEISLQNSSRYQAMKGS